MGGRGGGEAGADRGGGGGDTVGRGSDEAKASQENQLTHERSEHQRRKNETQ
jgi:hypothetical protein